MGRRRKEKRVLVLNANYMPIAIANWKDALESIYKNEGDPRQGYEYVEAYDHIIKTSGGKFYPLPAVVRLPNYVDISKRKISFNKGNLFLRDKMTCAYCGHQDLTCENLTYDHVIPKSKWKKDGRKGTPTRWENIVTCCRKCNLKKADKSLKEAGFTLKKEPKQPEGGQYILGLGPWSRVPIEWDIYIPPMYKHLIEKRKFKK